MSKPPVSRNKPRWYPSPNHGERRDGLLPELVVLHYTAMANAEVSLARLCSTEHEVSAHYLIARTGEVVQLVDEKQRAWHAGAGAWAGRGDVNSRSIGIELENSGLFPFPEPQIAALTLLISDIRARWGVAPEGVIGHSDFAPARKRDPGPRFDWKRLARSGQSVWPELGDETPEPAAAGSDAGFLADAARFGYPAGEGAETILAAFRLRFRPWARGPLDGVDHAMARNLADRFGVDRAPSNA